MIRQLLVGAAGAVNVAVGLALFLGDPSSVIHAVVGGVLVAVGAAVMTWAVGAQ